MLLSHQIESNSFVTLWTVAHQAPCLWSFLGKNTGVGCHFLLQGIFLTQGSNLRLLHWQASSLSLCHQGSPSASSGGQLQSRPSSRSVRQLVLLICEHVLRVVSGETEG